MVQSRSIGGGGSPLAGGGGFSDLLITMRCSTLRLGRTGSDGSDDLRSPLLKAQEASYWPYRKRVGLQISPPPPTPVWACVCVRMRACVTLYYTAST